MVFCQLMQQFRNTFAYIVAYHPSGKSNFVWDSNCFSNFELWFSVVSQILLPIMWRDSHCYACFSLTSIEHLLLKFKVRTSWGNVWSCERTCIYSFLCSDKESIILYTLCCTFINCNHDLTYGGVILFFFQHYEIAETIQKTLAPC